MLLTNKHQIAEILPDLPVIGPLFLLLPRSIRLDMHCPQPQERRKEPYPVRPGVRLDALPLTDETEFRETKDVVCQCRAEFHQMSQERTGTRRFWRQ